MTAVVDVRTITGVELVKLGRWEISNMVMRVTPADMQSMIDAHRAGVKRKPAIKIGHDDTRFDGAPAMGYVDHLRLSSDGATLLGDYVNVPAMLADLIPYAYPERSIEAYIDYRHQASGTTWPMVIDAVALLGAFGPGVTDLTSLQAVADLYGVTVAARQRTVAVAAARRRRNQRSQRG